MKILFYTTSTFTDIQDMSSKLIKNFFPDSEHVIIDGRQGWYSVWYKWLEDSKKREYDWIIHIDEDCFLTDNKEILETISYMDKNDIDISGCADGYHEYRGANHVALNSFFMILNKKCVDTWFNRKELVQFKDEWIEEYPFTKNGNTQYIKDIPMDSNKRNFLYKGASEPYYDFMWTLKDNGIVFNYLEPFLDTRFYSTNLLNSTIIHMWYQRNRNTNMVVSKLHGNIPNKKRFDDVISYLNGIIE